MDLTALINELLAILIGILGPILESLGIPTDFLDSLFPTQEEE